MFVYTFSKNTEAVFVSPAAKEGYVTQKARKAQKGSPAAKLVDHTDCTDFTDFAAAPNILFNINFH